MERIADFNGGPAVISPAQSTAIVRVMNPESHQILDELGLTLVVADPIQMLHQTTARFTDFRFLP